MRLPRQKRAGTTAVECAFIYPAVLLLVLGLMIGGMGIFRYQELATLAREGARYASVHGTRYAADAGVAAPAPADIYKNSIVNRAVALDTTQLTYSITYNTSNQPFHVKIDSSGNILPVQNTVTVTLTYRWIPEAFLGGITLSSTSVMPMSY
jgi:Flp pilus assembly protein TadG